MPATPLASRARTLRPSLWALGSFALVLGVMLVLAFTNAQTGAQTGTQADARHPGVTHAHWSTVSLQTQSPSDEPATTPDQTSPEQATPDQATPEQTKPAPKYSPRPAPLTDTGFTTLGDLDDLTQLAALEFSDLGAGIKSIQLPDDFETVKGEVHVTLQARHDIEGTTQSVVPFAAITVKINDEAVDISGWKYPIWNELETGVFEAYIDDIAGNPVLRIQRRFTLKPNTQHGFYLDETVENLSTEPITAQLITTGPIDMPKAGSSYGGDRRRIRYGFMQAPEIQGSSLSVQVDEELKSRTKLLGKKVASPYGKTYPTTLVVWPNDEMLEGATRLSWLAMADRYFVVAMHPKFDPLTTVPEDKLLNDIMMIDRFVDNPYANAQDATQILRLIAKPVQIVPGESVTTTLGVYAGPRNRPMMNKEPEIAALNMPAMVVSNLGGICAPCTFSWLTDILIGVLRTFHAIVGDWAVSILLLVVLVRGCLHPVTRWSQIRVQRFSVQMQAMAPKQKAIKEKYKDDSKKLQAEMGKLWKEEGISPAGMLGCLPMFLQSPVWIALYATLFFASELRHEPAFYGVFQNALNWQFMNDLSAPDGAIPLPASMHFSFAMWGSVESINILPLLLGVVFYLHQKYLTPPTQATMTPEQESQQKMMKVMMVFLFPVMMYAAPSGLALYFITNSTMGIIENKWIRAHMKKHGMLEIENIRAEKKDKGPGFLQRMTEAADAQKQLKEKGPAQINPASKNSRRGKM